MGQQGAVWTRIAKDRESSMTLAEGYFQQWKDTAYNRTEYSGRLKDFCLHLTDFKIVPSV